MGDILKRGPCPRLQATLVDSFIQMEKEEEKVEQLSINRISHS